MDILISTFIENIPRSRIAGVLGRLRRGQPFRIAVLSEALSGDDERAMLRIADEAGPDVSPHFVASVIDAMYEQRSEADRLPDIVWTGPRVEVNFKYTPTLVAARRIIDQAKQRVTIAGYQISAAVLERFGIWSALSRNVRVEAIVNDRDVSELDAQIMIAKGIRLHRVAPTKEVYAKFHIKAITCDGTSGLVGSANFTPFGQSANIEMGLLVCGIVAGRVEAMLYAYLEVARSTGWAVTT